METMKTSDEVNWENLLILIGEAGSDDALAEKYGCTAPYIRQLKLKSKDSGSGKPKGIGRATARKLEDCMGKPHGWLDQDHSGGGIPDPTPPRPPVIPEEAWKSLTPKTRALVEEIAASNIGDDDITALQSLLDWAKRKEKPWKA